MIAFLWAQNFGFSSKNPIFCHTTPILVNDPFLALRMTVNFPPWKQFLTFRSGVTAVSVKKIRLTCQKVFPLPTMGASSASKSPSALSAQALRARVLCARAGKNIHGESQPLNEMSR